MVVQENEERRGRTSAEEQGLWDREARAQEALYPNLSEMVFGDSFNYRNGIESFLRSILEDPVPSAPHSETTAGSSSTTPPAPPPSSGNYNYDTTDSPRGGLPWQGAWVPPASGPPRRAARLPTDCTCREHGCASRAHLWDLISYQVENFMRHLSIAMTNFTIIVLSLIVVFLAPQFLIAGGIVLTLYYSLMLPLRPVLLAGLMMFVLMLLPHCLLVALSVWFLYRTVILRTTALDTPYWRRYLRTNQA